MIRKLLLGIVAFPFVLVSAFLGLSTALGRAQTGRELSLKLDVPHPAIVAHRGASALAPEETRAAYLIALKMNVDYLELDLQRTKDGVLIALHDDTLERTTDIARVFPDRKAQPPESFTYAELQRLDAGSWFNAANPVRARPSFQGLRIARIEEVIDIAEKGAPIPGLYIETKGASRFPGIEEQLVALLRRRGWMRAPGAKEWPRGRLIFQSFEADSLLRLKALAPDVPRVYLISSEMKKKEGFPALIRRAQDLGSGIGPVGYYAFAWYTGPAHKAGLIVHPYTINKPWQMRLLRASGADGLFTDASHIALPLLKTRPRIDTEELIRSAGY